MIRHIVTWKLKAEDEAAKAIAAAEIATALEGLVSYIPEIISLKVARNIAYSDKNFDVVLVAEYATLEDLETYQVHPEHIKAAGVVGARVSARASIDFEI